MPGLFFVYCFGSEDSPAQGPAATLQSGHSGKFPYIQVINPKGFYALLIARGRTSAMAFQASQAQEIHS